MANNFKNLSALNVQGKTARFTFYQIDGEPYMDVKPATEANKPYFNAVLKKSGRRARAISAMGVNAAIIAENRATDRDLFPKHVVTGWGNVKNDEGSDVPFSEEACAEYLEALPDWLFDDLRAFVGNSGNFLSNPSDGDMGDKVED